MVSSDRGVESLQTRARPRPAQAPLPFDLACARLIIVAEHLMAEGAAMGGVRVALPVEGVRFLPAGVLEIAPPRADEPRSDDARDLSYALGALLFTWVTGGAPPKRATMSIAHERALRRALSSAELSSDAVELLRRLLAWDPGRRPWPEAAIATLQDHAGVLLELLRPPDLSQDDLATERGRDTLEETAELDPEIFGEPRGIGPGDPRDFAVSEDREVLFFPDSDAVSVAVGAVGPAEDAGVASSAGEPDSAGQAEDARTEEYDISVMSMDVAGPAEEQPDDQSDADDPFSIPDHTRVVPFSYRHEIGEGLYSEDDDTDPDLYGATSADERTDPEGSQAIAVMMGMDETDAPTEEEPSSRAERRQTPAEAPTPVERASLHQGSLEPVPAPIGVRLNEPPDPHTPNRVTPAHPAQRRSSVWAAIALGTLLIMGTAALLLR